MSPLGRGFLPKVERRHAFSYLFPEEDARLLASDKIGFTHRLLYGVLAREGMRAGEATDLAWREIDLERGLVRLDANKTDEPRAWALDQNVTLALRQWRDRQAGPGLEAPVFASSKGTRLKLRADDFRDHLARAGVSRPELFERSKTRHPIRVHDLRATFVTVSLANGRSETWVADRTGHRSSEMINRYRRPARTHAELGLGALVPLDQALPELRTSTQGGHQVGTKPDADRLVAATLLGEIRGRIERRGMGRHLISNQAPSATRSSLRSFSARGDVVPRVSGVVSGELR